MKILKFMCLIILFPTIVRGYTFENMHSLIPDIEQNNCVQASSAGLFIGASNGFFRYNFNSLIKENSLPAYSIDITLDTVTIAAGENGVLTYNTITNAFRAFTLPAEPPQKAILNGDTLFAAYQNKLFYLNTESGTYSSVSLSSPIQDMKFLNGICYFITASSLYRTVSSDSYIPLPLPPGNQDLNHIFAAGNKLYITNAHGFLIFDASTNNVILQKSFYNTVYNSIFSASNYVMLTTNETAILYNSSNNVTQYFNESDRLSGKILYFAKIDNKFYCVTSNAIFSLNENLLNYSTAFLSNIDIFPNPFKQNITIRFFLKKSERITISLYTLFGEEVRVLINKRLYAGESEHTLVWDGRDNSAEQCPPGLYILKLTANQENGTGAETRYEKIIKD